MTAPDQVLTDLLAADLNSHTWGNEYENAAHEEHTFDGGCMICRKAIGAIVDRVALVVEQHTQTQTARIATVLEDFDWHIQNASNGAVCAAEADDGQALMSYQSEMGIYKRAAQLLRAALEGEQR